MASLVSEKFSNSHNTSSRLHWRNRWMGTAQWWSKTAILTQGKTVKLQAIRTLC